MSAAATYFIGGFATDRQLYEHQLEHIPRAVYLPFPVPEPADTMATYARKFIPLIDTAAPFNIVATSMGGIITMELVKHIAPEKVILISSVKCRAEMPWRLRQLKYTRLYRLLPGRAYIPAIRYGSWLVPEIRNIPGLRDLVIRMAGNNAPGFLSWCVHAIVRWEGGNDYREDIIHIHGTRNAMFPYRLIRNAIPVEGGTHNMLLTRKEEITALLQRCLASHEAFV